MYYGQPQFIHFFFYDNAEGSSTHMAFKYGKYGNIDWFWRGKVVSPDVA